MGGRMRAAELTDDTHRALQRRGGEHGGCKDGRRGVTTGMAESETDRRFRQLGSKFRPKLT